MPIGASHAGESDTLVEEAIQAWRSRVPLPQVSGWSSDWSAFQNINQWIAPFPRWGALDKIINRDTSIATRLRVRLGTLGEIIPVLFDELDHLRVLFRVGDRLYYCKSRDPSCGCAYDPEFDLTDYEDVLEILSVTYTEFLSLNGAEIANIIDDTWMRDNLDSSDSTRIDSIALRQVKKFDEMRKSAIGQDREHTRDKTIEAWSEEDLIAVRDFIQRDVLKPW